MDDPVGDRQPQSSGTSQQQQQVGAPEPVANARPGSLLSALNNNTNNLLPRIIKRLNNTNVPSFKTGNSSSLLVTQLI
jgi:hypothetical protein